MAASVGGLSILSILGTIIARLAAVDVRSGVWPAVVVLPLIGLPITLVVLIVFFVVRFQHQRRIARDGGN
jgi:hypothetical protein